jgi:hypothetical protein
MVRAEPQSNIGSLLGARQIVLWQKAGNRTISGGFIWLSSQVANMPSTAIRSTQYDPATRILSVWFVPSGHRYDYADVAPATYAAFRKAASKGRFFNEFIRDHYSYRRVA